jgi:glycosyl hydrolase family 26
VARGSRLLPAAAIGLVLAAAAGSSNAAHPGRALGLYEGAYDTAGIRRFEQWLGRDVRYVLDYVPDDSWRSIEWPVSVKLWGKTDDRLVLGVPMIPRSVSSLAEGAAGAYNGHFRQLARNLLKWGRGDAILRLGWEFSGDWYRWKVLSNGDADLFAAYWRQIVNTMRGVAPNLKFDWNPALGHVSWDMSRAYPGDAHVDYIGLDAYDQGWAPGWQDPVLRWNDMMNTTYGLKWHRDFAKAHGKPMTFPEWGLFIRPDGHGGGDNPYYIEQMHAWITRNRVAYHIYFNVDAPDGQHSLLTGRFPGGAEMFRRRFGLYARLPED